MMDLEYEELEELDRDLKRMMGGGCVRERHKILQRVYLNTLKGKLMSYRHSMLQKYREYPNERLLLRLHQSIIRIEILEKILKERGVKLEDR